MTLSGVGGGAGGYEQPNKNSYGYAPVVNAEPEPECCTCQQGAAGPPGPPGDDGHDGRVSESNLSGLRDLIS